MWRDQIPLKYWCTLSLVYWSLGLILNQWGMLVQCFVECEVKFWNWLDAGWNLSDSAARVTTLCLSKPCIIHCLFHIQIWLHKAFLMYSISCLNWNKSFTASMIASRLLAKMKMYWWESGSLTRVTGFCVCESPDIPIVLRPSLKTVLSLWGTRPVWLTWSPSIWNAL